MSPPRLLLVGSDKLKLASQPKVAPVVPLNTADGITFKFSEQLACGSWQANFRILLTKTAIVACDSKLIGTGS